MDLVKCFWLEPTEQVEVSLRRYRGTHLAADCASSGYGYHNASKVLTRGHRSQFPDYHGDWHDHSDPAWPQHCSCGYSFADTDVWQVNPDDLYRRVDTGELFTMDSAPAGAMLNAEWQDGWTGYRRGADGIILAVKLPNHSWWTVDGPAYRDGKQVPGSWTRHGTVPVVTAHPSIDAGSYHGWLEAGQLRKC